jgi:nucleoside-diphosphate-sugar epimerase
MYHLILGYGYCGYYLAQELLKRKQHVTAVSRHLNPCFALPQLNHLAQDLTQPLPRLGHDTIVYYFIPPVSQGATDSLLENFLNTNTLAAKRVIYCGSSGVYGNHQGAWVNETAECYINNDRQKRRLNAEQQWQTYCQHHNIELTLLRVAGIYGPHRLPMEAATERKPILNKEISPFINHIYIKDLATIMYHLGLCEKIKSIYNIADGNPKPMGTMQQLIAAHLNIAPPLYENWEEAWQKASPMKKEFMQGSKRLAIHQLQKTLNPDFIFTTLKEGIIQSL